jgi:hypothetical protein
MIADPDEKLRLGRQFSASAVDMESATLADLCAEAGLPFGCVRSISDRAEDRLSPQLVGMLAGGQVRPLRLAANLLRSPRLAAELMRLARDTRRAAELLAGDLLSLAKHTSSSR